MSVSAVLRCVAGLGGLLVLLSACASSSGAETLLDGASPDYPEVLFINKSP